MGRGVGGGTGDPGDGGPMDQYFTNIERGLSKYTLNTIVAHISKNFLSHLTDINVLY